jgi:hypothetical protein
MFWYVLYTNPKAEKRVSEQLTKMGITNYCPLITKVKQWSDRKKKVEEPLFTSYVFVTLFPFCLSSSAWTLYLFISKGVLPTISMFIVFIFVLNLLFIPISTFTRRTTYFVIIIF